MLCNTMSKSERVVASAQERERERERERNAEWKLVLTTCIN